ncbi:MAG TPA: PASTA domain-containing protein [Solirubrobacterales bacterium]|nr:PASTA domain-containing protein [Solirubrobacterales bacterium]
MAEVDVGSVVDGRYRVVSKIGGGGMADVWLAEDANLERRIALKVLHRRFAQDREFVMRFQREAESAAGLQHPNIVAVFDRGEWEGTYYIAMQYVEGPTLKQLIDSGITVEQGVAVIRQVLQAAGYAHRQGIVHRDLKPQNVIVDPEGKAVVTDFGIARAGVSEITQTGSVMGTPHYLSPEQAQGFEVTAVSDLYSVGVMLYEALTGRVPFEGESAVAVAMKQVSQMPQRPSSIQPRVSPALDAVVMRALEKDPGQRFQSADAFIAALDQAMREPGAAGRGTQSFAALPPVVVAEGEEGEKDPEEARKRRRNRWIIAALVAIVIGALIGIFASRSTPSTAVPSVEGRSLQRAEEILEQRGFTVNQPPKQVHRMTEAGTVLEQDPLPSPPAGEAEENCSFLTLFCSKPSVTLTISIGPGEGAVPRVNGLSQGEATKKLEAAEFEVATEKINSQNVEEGDVVKTEPGGGSIATHGSTVTIFISTGPKLVKVPVLVDKQRRLAVQEIRARGLTPEVGEEESGQPVGRVLRQSPSAGQELEPGATVQIVVSSGRETKKMPGVVSQERREAVETVRAAGLTPVVEEEETRNEEKIGLVIRQSPSGGTELTPGSEVTLIVGKRAAVVPEEEPEEEEIEGEEGLTP